MSCVSVGGEHQEEEEEGRGDVRGACLKDFTPQLEPTTQVFDAIHNITHKSCRMFLESSSPFM